MPIIVRSLAESFSTLEEDQLPIGMASDFLLTLDLDLTFQNSGCRIVDEYECAWWKGRKPRTLDGVKILDSSSMKICIEKHHGQTLGNTVSPSIHSHSSVLPDPAVNSEPSLCTKCDQYREILNQTLQDILDMNAFAKAKVLDTETQWNLNMRRASTFHLLHEASVNKECAGNSSAPSAHYSSEMVVKNARQEFTRLSNLPVSSHKWTWGEDLTEREVLELRRLLTRPRNREHSGYYSSLKDGKLGDGSPLPSLPASFDGQNISPNQSRPPSPGSLVSEISYFKKKRNLIYDPLGKMVSHPAHLSSSLAELSTENVTHNTELLSYAEDIVVSSNVSKTTIDVADDWKSGSEDEIDRPHSAGSVQDVETGGVDRPHTAGFLQDATTGTMNIEDKWDSGSDDERRVLPITSVNVEDEWVSGSDGEGNVIGVEDQWDSDTSANEAKEGPEDEWASASDDDQEAATDMQSSPLTVTSQLMVSPSRITLSRSSVPLPDAWPPISPTDPNRVGQFRRYGPEDFTNLHDHMFEDLHSDSDGSEE